MTVITTCGWVQDRLLIYLAGEMTAPEEAAKLCRHLETCAHCTAAAEALAETAETLEGVLHPSVPAPATLDARVMAAVRDLPAPARRFRWPGVARPSTGRRPLAFAAATALCFLSAGFLLGKEYAVRPRPPAATEPMAAPIPPTSPPTVQLNLLAGDHWAYLENPSPAQVPGPEPRRVARAMTPLVSFPVTPLDLDPGGARLIGARRCEVQGVPVAFLLYDWRGERVSLFQMDGRKLALPGLRETVFEGHCFLVGERDGLTFALWCRGTTNFVLVARLAPAQLLRLASTAAAEGESSTRG